MQSYQHTDVYTRAIQLAIWIQSGGNSHYNGLDVDEGIARGSGRERDPGADYVRVKISTVYIGNAGCLPGLAKDHP